MATMARAVPAESRSLQLFPNHPVQCRGPANWAIFQAGSWIRSRIAGSWLAPILEAGITGRGSLSTQLCQLLALSFFGLISMTLFSGSVPTSIGAPLLWQCILPHVYSWVKLDLWFLWNIYLLGRQYRSLMYHQSTVESLCSKVFQHARFGPLRTWIGSLWDKSLLIPRKQ